MPKLCINFAPLDLPLTVLARAVMKSGVNPLPATKLRFLIIRAICPKEHFAPFCEKQE